jgi:hypothetical protein
VHGVIEHAVYVCFSLYFVLFSRFLLWHRTRRSGLITFRLQTKIVGWVFPILGIEVLAVGGCTDGTERGGAGVHRSIEGAKLVDNVMHHKDDRLGFISGAVRSLLVTKVRVTDCLDTISMS